MDEITKAQILEVLAETQSPEARQSGNVTGYYKGHSIQITCRDPHIDLDPIITKMKEAADKMASLGFLPSWNSLTNETLKTQTPVLPLPVEATPAPDLMIDGDKGQGGVCLVHGTKLVWKTGTSKITNKPYAFWACPTLNADGSFCRSASPKK